MKQTNLVVVGAGAMGSLFGGLLAEKGMAVTLLDPWQEHIDTIKKNGLKMVGYGGERIIRLDATTNGQDITAADLVFFQCKAVFNELAANSVKHLFAADTNTVAISFQNGIGNEEEIGRCIGMERILGGLTAQGGNIESPGIVHNHTELPSYIGEMTRGISDRSLHWAKLLSEYGLPTNASEDIRLAMWKKLFANIGISSISAIPNLTIGEISSNEKIRNISYSAIDEALDVAHAEGFKFTKDQAREVFNAILDPVKGTPNNKSSLCVDVLNKRPSEIDYINGAIVKMGEKHRIKTPVNSTLLGLVKGIESHYGGNK